MPELLATLLPLTALENPFIHGIDFLQWLKKTRQQAWQMLPIHDNHVSPYSSFGIGLNPRLLQAIDLPAARPEFVKKHQTWLLDYCLFMALSEHFKTDNWTNWPQKLANRDPEMLRTWKLKLVDRIDFFVRQQSFLDENYSRLKQTAAQNQIQLIGDIPFYLPLNSPLVWMFQECFLINPDGTMPYVSGAQAEDHFIRQVWGHPLYRNDQILRLIELWKLRLSYAAELYDWVRMDSAIRFFIYGKIHTIDETLDTIERGPGEEIFAPIIEYCHNLGLNIFLEDVSGYDLSDLRRSMEIHNVPGIGVFTYSLTNSEHIDKVHFDPEKLNSNCVFYTSNHDTPTLLGYIQELTDIQKSVLVKLMGLKKSKNDKQMALQIRNYFLKKARRLILPIQDWLLTTDRINIPGTIGPHNWNYTLDLSKLKAP
jgi:4-alpha-glucanotransferase